MKVKSFVLVLLTAGTAANDPCGTTPPPTPAPAPSPTLAPKPAPTPAPGPALGPGPKPGCVDQPGDWKSSAGSTCADYESRALCTLDGGYGPGWALTDGSFDRWAVNGVAANVACCGCGGGSTVSGKQACQGHSHGKAACGRVGCCYWHALFGCRAKDKDAQCYSDNSGDPCDTTVAPGPGPKPGNKKKVIGGLIAGGIIAGAIGAAVVAKSSTTAQPQTTTSATQGAQTSAVTTTTQNSSSSIEWLWFLLGILALCCVLALCGGCLAALTGGKKKKKKKKSRAAPVSQPALEPAAQPIVEEQRELLPLEPYPMMPMAAPSMFETVQMVPTAMPTMVETAVPMMQPMPVETAVPMMQAAAPAPGLAMPAMPMVGNAFATQGAPVASMQGIGGYGVQELPAMVGGGFGTQALPGIL